MSDIKSTHQQALKMPKLITLQGDTLRVNIRQP